MLYLILYLYLMLTISKLVLAIIVHYDTIKILLLHVFTQIVRVY